MVEKQTLRRKMAGVLRRQTQRSRILKSRQIQRRLSRLPLYRRARSVLCYVALRDEVETRPLLGRILRDGKRLAVPVARAGGRMALVRVKNPKGELTGTGLFGIAVPGAPPSRDVSLRKLDLVILPGVAFDRRGHRLGRGKGYFDRFLSRIPRAVARVALAFEAQRVPDLPVQPHDCPVDFVITERQSYEHSDCR